MNSILTTGQTPTGSNGDARCFLFLRLSALSTTGLDKSGRELRRVDAAIRHVQLLRRITLSLVVVASAATGSLIKTNFRHAHDSHGTNDYAGTVIGGGVLSIPFLPNSTVPSPVGVVEEDIDNLFFTGGTLRYRRLNSTDRKPTPGTPGGTIEIASNAAVLTLNNTITGSAARSPKQGAGQMDCPVAGTYTGGTIIRGGTLRLVSDSAFGSGTIMLNGTTNTRRLRFGSDGQTLNNAEHHRHKQYRHAGRQRHRDAIDGKWHLHDKFGTTFTFSGVMSDFNLGTVKAGTTTNPRFNGSTGSSEGDDDLGNTSALLNTLQRQFDIEISALDGRPNTQLGTSCS